MELKIAFLVIVVSVSNVLAIPTYSQVAKVSLDMKNTNLEQIMDEIESQSEFYFIFNQKQIDVKRVVDIQVENKLITDILPELFKGTNVNYAVFDRKILLTTEPLENDLIAIASIIDQQQIRVSGTITDAATGDVMAGVNVQVKGTTIGAISDINGKYSIPSAVDQNATLVFSFIGYITQEASVAGKTIINMALSSEVTGLDEVVVIGYGTTKKVSVTGSLASVDTKVLKSVNTSDVATGLAGQLPGLRVTQRTGEPGSYSTVYDIRGFGTPLIVVDGIMRSDFNRFDPNEIESITILKDASAAVYGIKAANGVILVTTKKGKIGKPVITYSGNFELQNPTDGYARVGDAYEYAVMTTETEIYLGKDPSNTTYSPGDIQKFKDGTYPSTNWDDVAFRKNSQLLHHNLNISGGSEKIKYFTSIGYLDELGLYKSGDLNYSKYNVRSSVTGNITDNLTAQLNIDGIFEDKKEPSYTGAEVWHYVRMNKPTYSIYANDNPAYMQDFTYPYHPLAVTTAAIGGYNNTLRRTFQGNFTLDYKFKVIDGLSAKAMYGYYNTNSFNKRWSKTYSVYTYDKVTDTYLETGIQNKPSKLSGNYFELQKSTVFGQLNYEKKFLENHNVKVFLAYEERHEKSDNMYAQKEFAIDVDQFFAGVSANTTATSSGIYENANQNVIGRLNYDYSLKYLFELGFNYGGSSMFPKGKRWGFFPSTSVGWRMSEEKFIKNNFSFVTDLKLRASWGQMGDDGSSSFQFLTGYNYPSGNYIFNNVIVSGLGFRGMPNPNITWFTATSKNIGVDLSLFKGLISMQFDLFQRNRSGLLATRALAIPASVGANLPQENINSDMRRGFELVIGHMKNLGELNYKISANVTYARGQSTHIERAADGNSYLNWRNNMTDRWDNMRWGYKLLGQFQTVEEILNSPIQDNRGNRTLSPGDFKFEDINHDGILSDLDMMPITRSWYPDVNYGLNIGLSWKKFDMTVFFQGAANYNFEYRGYSLIPNRWGRNSLTAFFDRWHHEDIFDPNSPWVAGRYPTTGATVNVPSDTWLSTFWLPDASYLRLKNMEIGYTVENIKKINIQSLRIYVSGFNLYTWTKMRLLDPEQNPTEGWSGNNSYPITMNLNIGLNITF